MLPKENVTVLEAEHFFSSLLHWHSSPLWALACQTISLHFFLSVTNSLHLHHHEIHPAFSFVRLL
jgi:hypothetical protein